MALKERISRVYTISLPPELAKKAEALAKREDRTMSELFREAFRTYNALRVRESLAAIGEYASTRNPNGYTEEDVPQLIREVRAEEAKKGLRATRLAKGAV